MNDAEEGFGFDTALRAVAASDRRWRATDGVEDPRFARIELERFAHALAFVLNAFPKWTETVVLPWTAGTSETEVRVLTERALVVASIPWSDDGTRPEPLLRVRPLALLRQLDVDGFEYDPEGRPTGCTVTLLFEHGPGVCLGGADGADRAELALLLPWLLRTLDV
jgi:hypothetical protein